MTSIADPGFKSAVIEGIRGQWFLRLMRLTDVFDRPRRFTHQIRSLPDRKRAARPELLQDRAFYENRDRSTTDPYVHALQVTEMMLICSADYHSLLYSLLSVSQLRFVWMLSLS